MNLLHTFTSAIRRLGGLLIQPALAHCDTEDGPAVKDGRRALATANINYALKWVHPEGEDEVRAVFEKALRVRVLGPDAAEVADRLFLETLIRVHRAGEGAGFEGIKPTGTELPPQVVAADRALDEGTIDPLRGLIPDDRWAELERRFHIALSRRGFDVDDLVGARAYIEAYVTFFKYAEGEEHEHGSHGGSAPHHAHDEHHAHGEPAPHHAH